MSSSNLAVDFDCIIVTSCVIHVWFVLSYFILLILARRDKTRLHPAGLRLLQNCRYIINKQIMACVFPTCT